MSGGLLFFAFWDRADSIAIGAGSILSRKTADFSGKTIAPFCTSGGSDLSDTPGTIAEFEPEAMVLDGIRLGGGEAHGAEDALSDWITEIGLN